MLFVHVILATIFAPILGQIATCNNCRTSGGTAFDELLPLESNHDVLLQSKTERAKAEIAEGDWIPTDLLVNRMDIAIPVNSEETQRREVLQAALGGCLGGFILGVCLAWFMFSCTVRSLDGGIVEHADTHTSSDAEQENEGLQKRSQTEQFFSTRRQPSRGMLATRSSAARSERPWTKGNVSNWLHTQDLKEVSWVFTDFLRSERGDDILKEVRNNKFKETIPGVATVASSIEQAVMPAASASASDRFDNDTGRRKTCPGVLVTDVENSTKSAGAVRACETAVDSVFDTDALQPTAVNSTIPFTIIQFAAYTYYCDEGEGYVELEVMRIGDTSGRSACNYYTRDSSASAFKHYVPIGGRILFEPGVVQQAIRVAIIDNDWWDNTLEFHVELHDQGIQGAVLGESLWQAVVRVIDNDAFPTNKYYKELRHNQMDDVPKFGLLFEYFQYNFTIKHIRKGTIRTMGLKAFDMLYFLLTLLLQVFIVDYVLNPLRSSGSRSGVQILTLTGISAAMVLPFAVLHMCDIWSCSSGVAGLCKMEVQKALLSAFLGYTSVARNGIKSSFVLTAVMHDAEELVDKGYMCVLSLVEPLGRIVVCLGFQIITPFLFNKDFDGTVIGILFLFPALFVGVFYTRREITRRHLQATHKIRTVVQNHIVEMLDSYELIAGYSRWTDTHHESTKVLKKRNEVDMIGDHTLLTNAYAGLWLTTIVKGLYLFIGGVEVLHGTRSLGLFLANITVVEIIGQACSQVYTTFGKMQHALPALEKICLLLNLPNDGPERRDVALTNKKKAALVRKELSRKNSWQACNVDDLPIQVNNIGASYLPHIRSQHEPAVDGVSFTGSMDVAQGTLVAIYGPPRSGKCTLLKLIGGGLIPPADAKSKFFIPAHLRLLHIPVEPVLISGTLYDNLIYGVCDRRGMQTAQGGMERVLEVCMRLGFSDDLLEAIESLEKQGDWETMLSVTDGHLVSLARAIIADYPVLCLHRPTALFDDEMACNIMETLREFVDNKGVAPYTDQSQLRSRTCIFTTSKVAVSTEADQIYKVSSDHHISLISQDDVVKEALDSAPRRLLHAYTRKPLRASVCS